MYCGEIQGVVTGKKVLKETLVGDIISIWNNTATLPSSIIKMLYILIWIMPDNFIQLSLNSFSTKTFYLLFWIMPGDFIQLTEHLKGWRG